MNAYSIRSMNVLSLSLAMATAAALAPPASAQTPQPTVLTMERISISGQSATEIGRFSELPWISPDGRYVLFTTAANTLDRSTDDNASVPAPPDPNAPGFVGNDNAEIDVYLLDRSAPVAAEAHIRRLSRRELDNGTPLEGSSFGVMSDDGKIAVFQSKATDLDKAVAVEGSIVLRKLYMVDLNPVDLNNPPTNSNPNFGAITMITQFADADPNTKKDHEGRFPAISGDGKFIYFASRSRVLPLPSPSTLLFDPSDKDEDVFRYEVATGAFSIVTPASTLARDSFPAASFDGQWVAIESEETANVLATVPVDMNDTDGDSDVFLVNGASADGTMQPPTFPVSLSTAPTPTMGAAASRFPAISGDARYVAFVSWADDLVPGDGLGNPDTFLRDMSNVPISNTGPTVRVSVGGATPPTTPDNTNENGCSWGCRPSVVHVPADATHPAVVAVAFVTLADFDTNDTNGAWDVYVRVMREDNLNCGATYLVSAPPPDAAGVRAQGDMASFNPNMRAEWMTGAPPPLNSPLIFPDGVLDGLLLRIAFESYSTNLDPSAPADNNQARDIYYTELLVQPPYCP